MSNDGRKKLKEFKELIQEYKSDSEAFFIKIEKISKELEEYGIFVRGLVHEVDEYNKNVSRKFGYVAELIDKTSKKLNLEAGLLERDNLIKAVHYFHRTYRKAPTIPAVLRLLQIEYRPENHESVDKILSACNEFDREVLTNSIGRETVIYRPKGKKMRRLWQF